MLDPASHAERFIPAGDVSRARRFEGRRRRARRRLRIAGIVAGLVLAAAAAAVFLLGYCSYIITGGSMTGAISKGSLAIERRVSVDSLQVGDIITFHPPASDENVTHRIVSIELGQDGQKVFRTRGDANNVSDPWEMTLNGPRQAKFVFSIPGIGYALAFFTLRWVRTGMLALAALALLLGVILHLRQDDAEDEEAEDGVEAEGSR
jgi:signal peptidase I